MEAPENVMIFLCLVRTVLRFMFCVSFCSFFSGCAGDEVIHMCLHMHLFVSESTVLHTHTRTHTPRDAFI